MVSGTITLMRHGRPLLAPSGWIAAAAMAQWIERYDGAAIDAARVPGAACAVAGSVQLVATSTLARAISSVQALGRQSDLVDEVFCEAALPHAHWTLVKLPASLWALLFRLAWRCGYAPNAASYRDSKQRAASAAQRLIVLAAQGPVLLVGHGIFNRMIAAELVSQGWTASTRQGSAYWSCATFGPPQAAQLK